MIHLMLSHVVHMMSQNLAIKTKYTGKQEVIDSILPTFVSTYIYWVKSIHDS